VSGVFVIGLVGGSSCILLIGELLRRRQLREKYAFIWLLVCPVIAALGVAPGLLNAASDALGVADPVNLLLFLAVLVLLGVCLHLSWESSQGEEETRSLVEEVALLRHRLEALESGDAAGPAMPASSPRLGQPRLREDDARPAIAAGTSAGRDAHSVLRPRRASLALTPGAAAD
jgi:hypothetical protein